MLQDQTRIPQKNPGRQGRPGSSFVPITGMLFRRPLTIDAEDRYHGRANLRPGRL